MLVDPVDECTFWYTQEYIADDGYRPLADARRLLQVPRVRRRAQRHHRRVREEHRGRHPDRGRHRADRSVLLDDHQRRRLLSRSPFPSGTYDVTASKFGYCPGHHHRPGRHRRRHHDRRRHPVDAGRHLRRRRLRDRGRFTTGPSGRGSRSARAGLSSITVYTSPWNGYYDVTLPNGYTYDFTVHSMYQGYQDEVRPVTVASGDQVQNFSLLAASGNPAYSCYLDGGVNENFNGAFPPLGWTVNNNGSVPNNVWKRNDVVGPGEPDGRHRLRGRCRLGRGGLGLRTLQHRALVSADPDAGDAAQPEVQERVHAVTPARPAPSTSPPTGAGPGRTSSPSRRPPWRNGPST